MMTFLIPPSAESCSARHVLVLRKELSLQFQIKDLSYINWFVYTSG